MVNNLSISWRFETSDQGVLLPSKWDKVNWDASSNFYAQQEDYW